ncbi:hypothetical protein QJS10_CPB13g00149 [Acorus calamus]|uniref:Neprosin PEP catalytic domain-containing protein n=1 Tax=Acorus calamus TaxID=4465 RepID=A0AAV9DJ24_ACOCL|nr:hypothetical protein QJS10_CPB13g00149 [Acorus calamus]
MRETLLGLSKGRRVWDLERKKLKPSHYPGSDKFSSINKSHKIGIEFEGCPAGFVPIRRITKEELVTSKNLLNVFREESVKNRWAYVGTLHDGEFYGAQATLSVSNLSSIQLGQSSHAQIWVINGEADPNKINTVQAGWHVLPQLYGDSLSRFFVYWTADYYQSTGCYNLRCSGFVQLNPRITPGMELIVSSAEAHVNELTLSIFQDENTRDWWLTVGRVQEAVGYWPKSLFPNLSSKANKVIWGGVASSNQNQPTPPMGSGQFASEGDGKAAYFTQTLIAYSPGSFEPLHSDEQSVYDTNKCYSVSRPDNWVSSDTISIMVVLEAVNFFFQFRAIINKIIMLCDLFVDA